jgi:hypothetical protein
MFLITVADERIRRSKSHRKLAVRQRVSLHRIKALHFLREAISDTSRQLERSLSLKRVAAHEDDKGVVVVPALGHFVGHAEPLPPAQKAYGPFGDVKDLSIGPTQGRVVAITLSHRGWWNVDSGSRNGSSFWLNTGRKYASRKCLAQHLFHPVMEFMAPPASVQCSARAIDAWVLI